MAGPLENPVPTITSLAPDFATAYGAVGGAQSIRVLGLHFVSGTQGQWNGLDRPTQFISETEVRVTLNSLDLAFGGSGAIRVINPKKKSRGVRARL